MNTSTDPYYNLALEEYLLTNYTEGIIIMLWQNDNTIVVGRHQNTLEEINCQYVDENNIKVVRRNTGGGAVYHDLGNLNYSIIMDRMGTNENMMRVFAEPIITVLKNLGIEASFSGRNDIMIGGKKVSGAAQKIDKNRVLNHGCILFDSDLEKVSRSLNVRSEKFQSKSVKSVKSRVGNIKDYLGQPLTIQALKKRLEEQMTKNISCEILKVSESMNREVKKLADEKYRTWEWTYCHPIKCMVHNYQRYAGGTVEVYINLKDGVIQDCQIYGDFMATRSAEEIEEALKGCKYKYKEILEVLCSFQLDEYFGAVSDVEIAQCICCAEKN